MCPEPKPGEGSDNLGESGPRERGIPRVLHDSPPENRAASGS